VSGARVARAYDLAILVRPATADDGGRIGEIFARPPTREAIALVGDPARATALCEGLIALDHIPNDDKPTVVADFGGRVDGFLQYTRGGGTRITYEQVKLALRVAGPLRLLRALPRVRARQRVDIPHPPDSLYVAELHVDEARRGYGIGARLLEWADGEARRLHYERVTLTPYVTNRAVHLYERQGYTVIDRRDDAAYERYTGAPGRILMEKRLD
jgi:ribosomal protein S18 acetylase RimI-like enzyme